MPDVRNHRLDCNRTNSELRFQKSLRYFFEQANRDIQVRIEVPFKPYRVDFLLTDVDLAIEVDGGYHAKRVEQDRRRTRYLVEQRAVRAVYRVANEHVTDTHIKAVIADILDVHDLLAEDPSICEPSDIVFTPR